MKQKPVPVRTITITLICPVCLAQVNPLFCPHSNELAGGYCQKCAREWEKDELYQLTQTCRNAKGEPQ